MRCLNVSSARSRLPSLLVEVASKRESIVISRNGKPVAQLSPLPAEDYVRDMSRYPLRSVSITISDDFDEPLPELWEALHS